MGLHPVDQPYHNITLKPLSRPTAEQIRLVRALSGVSFTNLLELRSWLVRGGLGFGELLPEQVERICEQLRAAGIGYTVEPSPVWRGAFESESPA
jgi:hypothetical protein